MLYLFECNLLSSETWILGAHKEAFEDTARFTSSCLQIMCYICPCVFYVVSLSSVFSYCSALFHKFYLFIFSLFWVYLFVDHLLLFISFDIVLIIEYVTIFLCLFSVLSKLIGCFL